jgi:uracil phosphoribosyltransferase
MAKVYQSTHPIVQHKLTFLRDSRTEPKSFRELLKEITWLLLYEATGDLLLQDEPVTSPIGSTVGRVLAERVAFAIILRAGLGMVEPALELIPSAQVWHIGIYRDEETLEPIEYYTSLPEESEADVVFVLDPMLATGGSAVATVDMLKKLGIKKIIFVGVIAAPEGVERLTKAHPDVPIYIASVDDYLNEIGYIVPGLGDAGDRQFKMS